MSFKRQNKLFYNVNSLCDITAFDLNSVRACSRIMTGRLTLITELRELYRQSSAVGIGQSKFAPNHCGCTTLHCWALASQGVGKCCNSRQLTRPRTSPFTLSSPSVYVWHDCSLSYVYSFVEFIKLMSAIYLVNRDYYLLRPRCRHVQMWAYRRAQCCSLFCQLLLIIS